MSTVDTAMIAQGLSGVYLDAVQEADAPPCTALMRWQAMDGAVQAGWLQVVRSQLAYISLYGRIDADICIADMHKYIGLEFSPILVAQIDGLNDAMDYLCQRAANILGKQVRYTPIIARSL